MIFSHYLPTLFISNDDFVDNTSPDRSRQAHLLPRNFRVSLQHRYEAPLRTVVQEEALQILPLPNFGYSFTARPHAVEAFVFLHGQDGGRHAAGPALRAGRWQYGSKDVECCLSTD